MEGAHPATPDDLPACARLLAAAEREAATRRGGALLLFDRAPDAPPGVAVDEAGEALTSWAAAPGHVLLAGTLDGAVVGIAAGHVRQLPGERLGVLDCVYVEPAARGVGVGSALTTMLVTTFAGLECAGVDAPALPGDRETKQRLEGAGFSARLLVLHRRLP